MLLYIIIQYSAHLDRLAIVMVSLSVVVVGGGGVVCKHLLLWNHWTQEAETLHSGSYQWGHQTLSINSDLISKMVAAMATVLKIVLSTLNSCFWASVYGRCLKHGRRVHLLEYYRVLCFTGHRDLPFMLHWLCSTFALTQHSKRCLQRCRNELY